MVGNNAKAEQEKPFDGKIMGRSPVDMFKSPHNLQGFIHPQFGCLGFLPIEKMLLGVEFDN